MYGCTCCMCLRWATRWCGSAARARKSRRKTKWQAKESGNTITLENGNLRVSVDKQTGCITSLFDKKSNFETLASGRVRQPAAVLQGHAQGLRRVEHRSGHARCAAHDHRPCGFGGIAEDRRARAFASRAIGRIRNSCRPSASTPKATWSMSTTRSTGTRRTSC